MSSHLLNLELPNLDQKWKHIEHDPYCFVGSLMLTFMFKLILKVQNYDEVLKVKEIWIYLNQVFYQLKMLTNSKVKIYVWDS